MPLMFDVLSIQFNPAMNLLVLVEFCYSTCSFKMFV